MSTKKTQKICIVPKIVYIRGMTDFKTLADMWPSRTELAEDIGMSPQALSNTISRGRPPPASRWTDLVHAARARDIPISYEMLAEMAAKSP